MEQCKSCDEKRPHLHIQCGEKDYTFFTIDGYYEGMEFAVLKGVSFDFRQRMVEVTEDGMSENINKEDQETLVRMYDEGRELPDHPEAADRYIL